MKTKHFSKKLVLNKKTVINLNNREMDDVNGGIGINSGITKCTVIIPCNIPTYYEESCGTICYTDTVGVNPCWACV